MKVILTVLISIAVIALFMVIAPTITGGAIGVSDCKDSDGYDPFTAGAIQYKNWFVFTSTKTDRCEQGKVVEYYCIGSQPRFSTPAIPCKDGCETVDITEFGKNLKAARCKKTEIPCRDSDEGINEKKFGYVISNSGVNFDNCKDTTTLSEYYCNSNIPAVSEVTCDSAKGYEGCSGGVCKETVKNETPVKNESNASEIFPVIILKEGEKAKAGNFLTVNDANEGRVIQVSTLPSSTTCDNTDKVTIKDVITGTYYDATVGCANKTIIPLSIAAATYYFAVETNEISSLATVQVTWGTGSSAGSVGLETSQIKALHYIEGEKAKAGEWIMVNDANEGKILQVSTLPSSTTCDPTDKVSLKDVLTQVTYDATVGCLNKTISPLTISAASYHLNVETNEISSLATVQVTWGTGSSAGNVGLETTHVLK